jgi:hypothetical protein
MCPQLLDESAERRLAVQLSQVYDPTAGTVREVS